MDWSNPATVQAVAAAVVTIITAIGGLVVAIAGMVKAIRNEKDIRDVDQRQQKHLEKCPNHNGSPPQVFLVPAQPAPASPEQRPATGKQ